MNTITGVELIKAKISAATREAFNDIKTIITLSMLEQWMTNPEEVSEMLNKRIDFDMVLNNSMTINIDEFYIDIDGESLTDWLSKHFTTHFESDKQITITL